VRYYISGGNQQRPVVNSLKCQTALAAKDDDFIRRGSMINKGTAVGIISYVLNPLIVCITLMAELFC
jgi:hypothetical protein